MARRLDSQAHPRMEQPQECLALCPEQFLERHQGTQQRQAILVLRA